MSFKPVSVEKKIEAVSRVVAGEKVQPVARDVGVHRISIYIWKERALSALEEALEPRKRGPKFKHSQKTFEEKLKEEVDKLNTLLQDRESQIDFLVQKLKSQKSQKENLESVRCPYCGCGKVYKNGTYKKRPKGFFDNLKPQKEVLIQRFLCPYCKKSFHIEKKGVFTPT